MVLNQKLGKPVWSGEARLPSPETQLRYLLAIYSWASDFASLPQSPFLPRGTKIPLLRVGLPGAKVLLWRREAAIAHLFPLCISSHVWVYGAEVLNQGGRSRTPVLPKH